MKKMKISTLVIAMLYSSMAFSQRTPAEAILQIIGSRTNLETPSDGIVGSKYIDSEFKYAQFANHNEDFLMRYNAYGDFMEVKIKDSVFALPKNLNYSIKFRYPEKEYKIFQFDGGNTGLFVVLKEMESTTILMKESIGVSPEHMPKNGFDPYKPPTFKRESDQLYVGYKNNTAELLPSNKKDILALFGTKAGDVESQAKKMKWNFKRNEDLIEIFNYYYSLS